MKKNILEPDRQQMLCEYIQATESMTYDRRGKFISAVTYFLQKAPKVSKRGYREFCKQEADFLIHHEWAKDAICHFLNTQGIGYSKTQTSEKQADSAPMVKRECRQQQLINDFILWLQNERDYSPNTLCSYTVSIKQFYSYCDDFTQDNCRRYIATLEQNGFKPQTLRLRITALEKLGEYLRKPVKLKRPKFKRKLNTENVPTEAEYKRLLDYLQEKNERYYFMVRLMGTTGCRVSELAQFTFEQVTSGSCTLKGKGSKYRQFFFTKEMQQLAKGKSGLVMVNKCGKPLSSRGLSEGLKDYCQKCGISRTKGHPHAFRHFFAKMYLKKTKDVIQLADLLGHGSVDTTRIYLQKSYDEQKREVNRVVNW